MQEISGKEIAKKIIDNLKSQPKPKRTLAAVLIGSNPASISFLKQKQKIAEELGVEFKIYEFNSEQRTTNNELRTEVEKLAKQEKIGGIIIQLPLPDHINRQDILNIVPQEKDVDVLNEFNQNQILPPAVGVVEEIIRNLKLKIKNYRVAVVGLGFLVGKPISEWLKDKCAELYLLDIGSDFSMLKNADLVISGVGKAGLIKPEMLKDEVIVIDFGYGIDHETWSMKHGTKNEKLKIYGDFDASSSMLHASGFYTPTPGGTGPILVAKLFENFYKLNQ